MQPNGTHVAATPATTGSEKRCHGVWTLEKCQMSAMDGHHNNVLIYTTLMAIHVLALQVRYVNTIGLVNREKHTVRHRRQTKWKTIMLKLGKLEN